MNRTGKLTKRVVSLLLLLICACTVFMISASAAWKKNGYGQWTYTGSDQVQLTGWQKLDGAWYYFNEKGIMQTGWQKISDTWYFFYTSGVMKTGWLYDGGSWYLFNGGGAMKTGWQLSGGSWYFLSGSGAMKTSWVKSGNDFYFCESDGKMKTGWLESGGKQYYLDTNGKMVTGQKEIDGTTYAFNEDGSLNLGDNMEFANEVLELVNKIRRQEGLNALAYSSTLTRIANQRAQEQILMKMGSLSHKRPDGSDWYTIFPEFNQSSYGTGENLAMNHATPDAVVKSWMESERHKQNILNKDFLYMGLGYTIDSIGNNYWVQLFSQGVR